MLTTPPKIACDSHQEAYDDDDARTLKPDSEPNPSFFVANQTATSLDHDSLGNELEPNPHNDSYGDSCNPQDDSEQNRSRLADRPRRAESGEQNDPGSNGRCCYGDC